MNIDSRRSTSPIPCSGIRWCRALLLLGLAAGAPQVIAAPGDLDPGFGDHGRVHLPMDGGPETWVDGAFAFDSRQYAIAEQPDGRVLVARAARPDLDARDSEAVVVRLLPDGRPDPSFGASGTVRFRFRGDEPSGVSDLAVQPDGRIVVAGTTLVEFHPDGGMGWSAIRDTAFARLNADGSLDAGFGDGGRLALDVSGAGLDDGATAVIVLGDGRIVAAGIAETDPGEAGFTLLRLTAAGRLDPGFGTSGRAALMSAPAQSGIFIDGLSQLPDGSFFACANLAGVGQVVGIRPDGTLDSRVTHFASGWESGLPGGRGYWTACALEPGGGLVMGGIFDHSVLARLTADGYLNTDFGQGRGWIDVGCDGCISLDQMGYGRPPASIAVLPDGRLAVSYAGAGFDHLLVSRYTADGQPDALGLLSMGGHSIDVGWQDQPSEVDGSLLLPTSGGQMLVLAAGLRSTTVVRLNATASPGASVVGLQSDWWHQSESGPVTRLVCRSGSSDGTVSVDYASRDETARSPEDYAAVSGTLSWQGGEDGCRMISVPITDDGLSEPTESFSIELSNPVGTGLSMQKARVYIVQNVASPVAQPTPPAGAPPSNNQPAAPSGGGATGPGLLVGLALLIAARRWRPRSS